METGESDEGVDPAAGPDGLDGVDESEDEAGAGGTEGESKLAPGSAWVPMWRGM